jgi:hypothetical protein
LSSCKHTNHYHLVLARNLQSLLAEHAQVFLIVVLSLQVYVTLTFGRKASDAVLQKGSAVCVFSLGIVSGFALVAETGFCHAACAIHCDFFAESDFSCEKGCAPLQQQQGKRTSRENTTPLKNTEP